MDTFYNSADIQNELDDITQKCLSMNLEDRIDSGISSMTLSDIEKARIVDEKLGEFSVQDSFTSKSILDSGFGDVTQYDSVLDEARPISKPIQNDEG